MQKPQNIILVESGATKSSWYRLDGQRGAVPVFVQDGMNVSTMPMETVKGIISRSIEGLGSVDAFYLYTAGVVTDGMREEIVSCLRNNFGIKDVDIQDDLVAAARAVCQEEAGIAAILGTGSNACFYNGKEISRKVYSGGFIIGDEGSAATLGKLFVSDYLKGLVPVSVANDFRKEFDASYAGIVEGVYRSSSPSAYLGGMAPFIVRHKSDPYISRLIRKNFQDFVERILLRYDTDNYPVGIVGGFAWACKEMLVPILQSNAIQVSKIIKAPIEELCRYHLNQNKNITSIKL